MTLKQLRQRRGGNWSSTLIGTKIAGRSHRGLRMRTLLIGFLVSAMTATAQTPATDDQQPQTTTQQQTTPSAEAQPKDQNRNRSDST
jgi:hypothetical protein